MRPDILKELREKDLLTNDQFIRLELLSSKKIVSVFYELRILLYLGVLLFTTGIGILIYKNIGDIGHMLSIAVLFVLTTVCFYFAFKNAADYKNERVSVPLPY